MTLEKRFFVSVDCIACDLCHSLAPKHFSLDYSCEQANVICQPVDGKELTVCLKALDKCPVGAIGRLGESHER